MADTRSSIASRPESAPLRWMSIARVRPSCSERRQLSPAGTPAGTGRAAASTSPRTTVDRVGEEQVGICEAHGERVSQRPRRGGDTERSTAARDRARCARRSRPSSLSAATPSRLSAHACAVHRRWSRSSEPRKPLCPRVGVRHQGHALEHQRGHEGGTGRSSECGTGPQQCSGQHGDDGRDPGPPQADGPSVHGGQRGVVGRHEPEAPGAPATSGGGRVEHRGGEQPLDPDGHHKAGGEEDHARPGRHHTAGSRQPGVQDGDRAGGVQQQPE